MKINFPLELTDQPIGLDEDGFARIDRVKTMLTPFFTLRRCHHHHSRAHPTIGDVERVDGEVFIQYEIEDASANRGSKIPDDPRTRRRAAGPASVATGRTVSMYAGFRPRPQT